MPKGRKQKAIFYARAIREGIHPGVILNGGDARGQRGPLLSPEFRRHEHFPLIEYAPERLREAGGKEVVQRAGDWRLLLDEMIALGVAGRKGLQSECGRKPDWKENPQRREWQMEGNR